MTDEKLKTLSEYKRQLRKRSKVNPIGRQCNMDTFVYRSKRYYDIKNMDIICEKCQALGYPDENKGTEENPTLERCVAATTNI